ncbi:MAG: fumarylacetoacetate hydrolase family protein [Rhizomicrobium sp.]
MIEHLPRDWRDATLLGRLLTKDGPTPILVTEGRIKDISALAPTVAQFLGGEAPRRGGRDLGPIGDLDLRRAWDSAPGTPRLLAPVDLQCIKAAGVTFAVSAVERVIEERARGEASRANAIRAALRDQVGSDIRAVKPGSPEAKKLKEALIADGLWSQYLEVAIGPDAEIFTKAPTLSSVGWGDWIGVRSDSVWSNPEPEIVLVCDRTGRAMGAALGNDVNLRCFEGRSALLLGKAKDNNASCAIGPFIRLFDESFSLDDVRRAEVALEVVGEDGYRIAGTNSMSEISRDPLELAGQTIGQHHRYPDGFVLFCGTMFAPTEDRGAPGSGFTHKQGDLVRVSNDKLGVLENKVTTCDAAPAWTFGIADLMSNLAARGLLTGRTADAEKRS